MRSLTPRSQEIIDQAMRPTPLHGLVLTRPEHVAIALIEEVDLVTRIIERCGITASEFVQALRERVMWTLPVTARTMSLYLKKGLRCAGYVAADLGFDEISPEHVFLGIVDSGAIDQVLDRFSLTPAELRTALLRLGGGDPGPGTSQPNS
jgi:hypothetical protein